VVEGWDRAWLQAGGPQEHGRKTHLLAQRGDASAQRRGDLAAKGGDGQGLDRLGLAGALEALRERAERDERECACRAAPAPPVEDGGHRKILIRDQVLGLTEPCQSTVLEHRGAVGEHELPRSPQLCAARRRVDSVAQLELGKELIDTVQSVCIEAKAHITTESSKTLFDIPERLLGPLSKLLLPCDAACAPIDLIPLCLLLLGKQSGAGRWYSRPFTCPVRHHAAQSWCGRSRPTCSCQAGDEAHARADKTSSQGQ
jgi:hypothetical protein